MPIARVFGLHLDHDGLLRGLPEIDPGAVVDVIVRRADLENEDPFRSRSSQGERSAGPLEAADGLGREGTGRFARLEDAVWFYWPGFARIVLRGVERIEVDAEAGADPDQLQAAILGPVQSVVLGLRGMFPLHASALVLGKVAVAFAGPSGAGKSTLAAALAARGHRFVTDDVCALMPQALGSDQGPRGPLELSAAPAENDLGCWDGAEPIHVWPSYPQQKLARTALGHLRPGRETHGPLVNPDEGKHLVDLEHPWTERAVPLERLFLLERQEDASARVVIERLSPAAALGPLFEHIHRAPLLHHALGTRSLFARAARLAQGVVVERLRRPFSFDSLDEVLQAIEQHVHEERAA